MEWWGLMLCVLWCTGVPTFACPHRCSCQHEQGLYVANCTSLPYNAGKVEVLNLLRSPDDDPLELKDGQFNLAKHLKYLNLRDSSINFIHKKAFYGAKSLIEIDLSSNQIEEIEATVFQHLTSLTTLILRGNPIQFRSEVPFLISNTLQHLDIGQCNIRSFPRGIFYGLKRLMYLSMDGNLLKSLKYNSLPKGLKYLNLSHNLIEDVPTEVLSALTNLRRLGLRGNPINCTCSLLNFQDYMSGRGVVLEDEEEVTCAVPFEYRGVSLSKVNENKLCLAEARREDLSHSLLKNKYYAANYLGSDHGYLDEDFQADGPVTLLPDSQAEVLFQNGETQAMGEMMRDEEHPAKRDEEQKEPEETKGDEHSTGLEEKQDELKVDEQLGEEQKGHEVTEGDENPATVGEEHKKLEETTGDEHSNLLEAEHKDPEKTEAEEHSVENNVEPVTESKVEEDGETVIKDIQVGNENAESHKLEEESKAKNEDNLLNGNNNDQDKSTQKTILDFENSNLNTNNNDVSKEPDENDKGGEGPEHNHEKLSEIITPIDNTDEKMSLLAKEDLIENNHNDENMSNSEPPSSINLNETHPVELDKESMLDAEKAEHVDELAEEGLLHANVDLNKGNTNDPSEDSTILPDIEETTENELIEPPSTEETIVGNDLSKANDTSSESPLMRFEINKDDSYHTDTTITTEDSSKEIGSNVTAIVGVTESDNTSAPVDVTSTEDSSKTTKDSKEEITEVEPTVMNSTITPIAEGTLPENPEAVPNDQIANEELKKPENDEKIKQVAGADIVMFCIAILVICLVLFSVYKCRRSRARQTMRVPKDIESNRGTEMQDMASLLPKPEDDDKKNHKYPDKEPSSETMKLIPETNEKESSNFAPAANQNNVQDKNMINNNAPGSPNGKTPLIKPSNPVTINPAAPIQRTKAKVGIIPDSIPRTPIFLQKTYTNGTKHV